MTTLTIPAGALLSTVPALASLADNRLPIGVSVKVARMGRIVAEFHAELMKHIVPLIAKHTDGGSAISPEDTGHAAFMEDAASHFDEKLAIEVETVSLSDLSLVTIAPTHIDLLLELGFVT